MGIVMLLLTACVAGNPSTNAGQAGDSSGQASTSTGDSINSVTQGTAFYTASINEGSSAESPQSAADIPVVTLPGPTLTTEAAPSPMTTDSPEQCLTFTQEGLFGADIAVHDVSITPPGAFESDASICNGSPCAAASFPNGFGSCQVGVRWNPDSGDRQGTVTLVFEGVCRTNTGNYCGELVTAPPPEGTHVRFLATSTVRVDSGPTGTATTVIGTDTDQVPTPSFTNQTPTPSLTTSVPTSTTSATG